MSDDTPALLRQILTQIGGLQGETQRGTAAAGQGLAELSRLRADFDAHRAEDRAALSALDVQAREIREWRAGLLGERAGRAPFWDSLLRVLLPLAVLALAVWMGLKG